MRLRINENTVWTDSQYYGADEILSHPFALTPPVQRAACTSIFAGPVPRVSCPLTSAIDTHVETRSNTAKRPSLDADAETCR